MSANGTPIIKNPPVRMDARTALEEALKHVGDIEHIAIVGLTKKNGVFKTFSDITLRDLHYLGAILQETALGPFRANEQAKALQNAMANQQIREITEKVTGGEA